MNIYEKIFDRLAELHMSQIELSRRTGIATSTISDWRKKKINPQADKLVAICKALDMSLVDLLCDGEEEKGVQTDYMLDERRMIEVFRTSDDETKRRLLRYFELLEICKQINENNAGTLTVNGLTSQKFPSSASDLTYTFSEPTDIASIQLKATKSVYV